MLLCPALEATRSGVCPVHRFLAFTVAGDAFSSVRTNGSSPSRQATASGISPSELTCEGDLQGWDLFESSRGYKAEISACVCPHRNKEMLVQRRSTPASGTCTMCHSCNKANAPEHTVPAPTLLPLQPTTHSQSPLHTCCLMQRSGAHCCPHHPLRIHHPPQLLHM